MTPEPHQGCTIYRAVGSSFNWARIPVFLLVSIAMGAAAAPTGARDPAVILALGDSLTAGYGLAPEESFPSQLEVALARSGVPARVVNGGVSGDTSAGGLARLDWLLADRPDLVIVELGANDGLRGLDPEETHRNLGRIIARIRAAGIDVLLAGMRVPPNLGTQYSTAFAKLYDDLAVRYGVAYYPFFLEGVAGDPAFNQEDGIHPTAEGVAVIVRNILPVVVGALEESRR